MKKLLAALLLTVTVCTSRAARDIRPSDTSAGSEKWVRELFLKSRQLPFSFSLDGVPSEKFIASWRRTMTAAPCPEKNARGYILTLQAPDRSLQVDCNITAFDDFPAVEWTLHFTNTGRDDSPQIADIRTADVRLAERGRSYTLYTARGSAARDTDFHLVKIPMLPDTTYSFTPTGGRSSSTSAFPFCNIDAGGGGVFLAIGWTGNWNASMSLTADGAMNLSAGIPSVDTYLLPGESIRSPKVALLFWSGADRIDGNNAFRRFLLAHHSPRDSQGQTITPPLCGSFDYGDPAPCGEYEALTELLARAAVERCERFGLLPEVFWLDAGWYKGCNAPQSNYEGRSWYNQTGNWQADPERFPRGLRPVADAIHAAGSKLMVWFEPERVYAGTLFDSLCQQWLLRSETSPKNSLLNLGNPEACDFLCRYMGEFIEANGIDLYRQDFNIPPNSFWQAADQPNRKGITEIRYIEGLYRYWDYLLERFPGLVIDNCASGGRRLDLETVSRSLPLWRTDCNYGEPNCQQCHQYGLSQFLPMHGTAAFWADSYHARSAISSAYANNFEIFSRTTSIKDMRRALDEFRFLRRYTLCDFYPLSGDESTTGTDRWIAWQFHDPDDGSGFIQAFRRADAAEQEYTVALHGLDSQSVYEITDPDTGKTFTETGSTLEAGLKLRAEKPLTALLLTYRKTDSTLAE